MYAECRIEKLDGGLGAKPPPNPHISTSTQADHLPLMVIVMPTNRIDIV
jgi:hypothetical protein